MCRGLGPNCLWLIRSCYCRSWRKSDLEEVRPEIDVSGQGRVLGPSTCNSNSLTAGNNSLQQRLIRFAVCGIMYTQHGDQPARKAEATEASSDNRIEWSQVRSRSLLMLLAALASAVVAAEMADYKRGLDAIVTKVQANGDAAFPVEDVDAVRALDRKASYLSV